MNNRSIRTPVAFALKNIDKNIDELVILAWFLGRSPCRRMDWGTIGGDHGGGTVER